MGNQLNCKPNSASSIVKNSHIKQSNKKRIMEQELLQQQALAYLLHQRQMARMRLDRSMSQRHPNQALPKGDPPSQSVKRSSVDMQNVTTATNHFVLIHGGGTGAWCWYKSIALLEEAGFTATAIDLLGSGVDFTDPNMVSGLAQYVKPLLQFLEKLAEDEMVILVGHDFGGACISYAMEQYPHKISKAVFLAATMVVNGQSAFEVFASEVKGVDNFLPNAQQFVYASGTSDSPTAVKFEPSALKDLFLNQCQAKDVALATVSMRPVPFAPLMERLTLTKEKYGKVPRFFIETIEDLALSPAIQEQLVLLNPPERVFKVKSDHFPLLSKPQSLHKIFVQIAG